MKKAEEVKFSTMLYVDIINKVISDFWTFYVPALSTKSNVNCDILFVFSFVHLLNKVILEFAFN